MFIQTEPTPNPQTLKFIPGVTVMQEGAADFRTSDDATASPLAERLFGVDGVEGVYFGLDFVSVSKHENVEWHHIKPAILGAIMEHFTNGQPILRDGAKVEAGGGHAEASEGDAEVVSQIVELLDTRVRPAVAQDGGDIVFHGFDNGVVYLAMQGACQGCPSSVMTLKHGIENLLRHYVPEVEEVRAV
jgi:Fe-S cluster biogenesis protein NfuA